MPRGSHRHLAFEFEAFLRLAGPSARNDGGACLWDVLALIVNLEMLAGWFAEWEYHHDLPLERASQDILEKTKSPPVCETTAAVVYL